MVDEQPIAADQVARKQFATAFRGFDQYEVRGFLAEVAAELASVQERERSLRQQLADAQQRAMPREIGEEELEAALGAETTRVLHAAREAAAEIRSRAEEHVARLLREANDEATRLRSEAETVLARHTDEAEAAAAGIVGAAEEAAAAARAAADAESAKAIEEAQQQGREMVAEAQAVRERILKDLARRRRAAAVQLEQLLAGRQRLLEAYEVVRSTLDATTQELQVAEAEARLAADAAGLRPPPDEPAEPAEPSEPDTAAAEESVVEPAASPTAAPEHAAPAGPAAAAEAPEQPERRVAGEAARVATGQPPTIRVVPALAEEGGPRVSDPPPAPAEERRSSSLRLLRRRQESEELPPLDDEVEGVRIIRPHDPAAAPAAPAASDAPAAPAASDVSVAAAPPEPGARPEPPADETAAAEPAANGTGTEEPQSDDSSRDDEVSEEGEVPAAAQAADDLFARLRATRADALARAEEVLAEESQPEADATAAGSDRSREPVGGPAAEAPDGEEAGAVAAEEPAADSLFERRDAVLEPAERALTRALKRMLADEQNEVLDTLRRSRAKATVETLLPEPDAHAARFAGAAADHLRAAAAAAAAEFGGDAPDVGDEAAELGSRIGSDLRARLSRTIDAAAGDDESLVEGISATYREWKSARAEPLARHHVASAYASAAFAALPDAALRWVVDPAEGGCPDCDDNALAGSTVKGGLFPTGQPHPPAHDGCRCLVVASN